MDKGYYWILFLIGVAVGTIVGGVMERHTEYLNQKAVSDRVSECFLAQQVPYIREDGKLECRYDLFRRMK